MKEAYEQHGMAHWAEFSAGTFGIKELSNLSHVTKNNSEHLTSALQLPDVLL